MPIPQYGTATTFIFLSLISFFISYFLLHLYYGNILY